MQKEKFGICNLELRICFVFRISSFEFEKLLEMARVELASEKSLKKILQVYSGYFFRKL